VETPAPPTPNATRYASFSGARSLSLSSPSHFGTNSIRILVAWLLPTSELSVLLGRGVLQVSQHPDADADPDADPDAHSDADCDADSVRQRLPRGHGASPQGCGVQAVQEWWLRRQVSCSTYSSPIAILEAEHERCRSCLIVVVVAIAVAAASTVIDYSCGLAHSLARSPARSLSLSFSSIRTLPSPVYPTRNRSFPRVRASVVLSFFLFPCILVVCCGNESPLVLTKFPSLGARSTLVLLLLTTRESENELVILILVSIALIDVWRVRLFHFVVLLVAYVCVRARDLALAMDWLITQGCCCCCSSSRHYHHDRMRWQRLRLLVNILE